jgi:hypothetical protein
MTVFREVITASIITLLMEAVSTSVNLYQTTRRNIAEDSHFRPQYLFFPSIYKRQKK